ncbi:Protein kinase rad3 [Cyphellophora attinorum]|uniref:Serine/threonine-protein kinase MEC1 n=1 Tax=Cyphellophora attinorum TaxID=1664694 RepID=A0A0N1P2U9_9EURO|nr:Protein kinase rad3 [Phialophora attinorum]KPI42986.1 Protein kinase rad3 [Phialophora attinorum]
MAAVSALGIRRGDAFDPPQSSMLAVRLARNDEPLHLNQASFNQLLEESLGNDENDQPNLGSDVAVNLKVIEIVIKAGVDSHLRTTNDDPFRANGHQLADHTQFLICLQVIKTAVERSPGVLFARTIASTYGKEAGEVPLYLWLLPRLITALAPSSPSDKDLTVSQLLCTCIQHASGDLSSSNSTGVADFLLGCISVLIPYGSRILSRGNGPLPDLDDDAFSQRLWRIRAFCHGLASRFNFKSGHHLLHAATVVLKILAGMHKTPDIAAQFRKTLQLLQDTLDDLPELVSNGDGISQLAEEVDNLGIQVPVEQSFTETGGGDLEWPDSDRARKRPRLSDTDHTDKPLQPSVQQQIMRRLTLKLTGTAVDDLAGLSTAALPAFKSASETQQTSALNKLATALCKICQDNSSAVDCAACDGESDILGGSDPAAVEILNTLLAMIPLLKRNSRARLSAMTALRRVLLHLPPSERLSLSSTAGEWTLQCLRSSVRDLRLCAISVLQIYVMPHKNYPTTRDNRVIALDFLQSLWDTGDAALQETAVLSLTRMAQVTGDEELNIVLLRLVEYLGHNNSYINALVYEEIQQLAQHKQITTDVMFRPFKRTLGLVVAKSMSRSHSSLSNSAPYSEYALPYLVLQQRRDMIEQFAAAHGSSTTLFDVCTAPRNSEDFRNLSAILSHLLVQGYPDPEETIMKLLIGVSDDFAAEDLGGWLNHDPIQTACTLLKWMGDAAEGKSSRNYQALQLLAAVLLRKPGQQSSSSSRRAETLGIFLENHALGIVSHFTVLLNDIQEPKIERKRSILALGETVRLGKGRIVKALPQICGCLRAALPDNDLCDAAFSSWTVIMRSLKEEDIMPLVDQTAAIIVKHWEQFNSASQKLAHDVIAELLKNHTSMMREIFETVPSFAHIPMLSKFEGEIKSLKRQMDERHALKAFIDRLEDENEIVVEQTLKELTQALHQKQTFLHRSILSEKPDHLVVDITRALLDACVRFPANTAISGLCGRCIGTIGCLDSNKHESNIDRKSIVVTTNFSKTEETVDFIMYFLEHILVKAFLSASTTRAQGFLGWAMQELLSLCQDEDSTASRVRSGPSTAYRRWNDLPEHIKNTLAPFQTTKYRVQEMRKPEKCQYPYFEPGLAHKDWLRRLVADFLHRASGNNVKLIYGVCSRIIHGQDLAIPSFLLPYTVLSLVTSGIERDRQDVLTEILNVLKQPLVGHSRRVQEEIKSCSQSVFEVLDYLSTWLQKRRRSCMVPAMKNDSAAASVILQLAQEQIRCVEHLLGQIPPDLISQRAIDCRSYARALFHWEQHVRSAGTAETQDSDLARMQDIYAQIDEPDGIEGLSAKMNFVSVEGRVLEHKKAGRWTTAQGWYQMHLTEHPDDMEAQRSLLECLRESGQHHMLLDRYDNLPDELPKGQLKPFAVEAAWATFKWKEMSHLVSVAPNDDFSGSLAKSLLCVREGNDEQALHLLEDMYRSTAMELTPTVITSLENSHDTLRRLHTVEDLRLLCTATAEDKAECLKVLQTRLDVLGSNVRDKHYLLTVWRAAMKIRSDIFSESDIASTWLTSARLARKARASTQAFDAVLAATALGDKSASIEEAKLIWQDGQPRKAIQMLEGAITSGAFTAHNYMTEDGSVSLTTEQQNYQNELTAKAYLLKGKWLDRAGQTSSDQIKNTFRKSTENFRKWEKGWYYLGRHYNKLLDSQKMMPPGKESQPYLTGELAKLVIENYMRSLMNGSKFIFQTLPKVLTLWFELVAGADIPADPRRGNDKFLQHNNAQRRKVIEECNKYIQKYVDRIQAAVLYTILPQVTARICHTNTAVYTILTSIVVKIVRAYPHQALWSLLAVSKSQSKDRQSRGLTIISKVVEAQKKQSSTAATPSELRSLITSGQRFADELLRISEYPLEAKTSRVSLAKDMGFNHKIAPVRLVVPCESCLTGAIPSSYDSAYLKTFRAFDKDAVTIHSFLDEALVLSSLQKPRKLTIRGSNGQLYGFNTMINRFLKRDVEASKRRLSIRTYAVVPLNEECGLIEWVDNLKTYRDIILKLYKDKSITPNYGEIRTLLDESSSGGPDRYHIFTDRILTTFPAVFHEWFVEAFPDPAAWFAARLRYTRSCSVMSIVGHVLGLGDRHGENILFEEDNGSLMHVDFNCLFDKGLTFEKPEHVPFRLTHNMVDAMGPHGYEGPWRKCSELTLALLRNNEDALMTILETFLHDPTTDFLERANRKKKAIPGVPNTPMEVQESVRGKVRGFLPGESVPLSVAGYAQEMVRQATDTGNLCRMYIGWCAFF